MTASTIINTVTAPLEKPRKSRRTAGAISPPKVVSIVDSSVSIDTTAEVSPITRDAERTGLLYLRYLNTFMIAKVNEVKVRRHRYGCYLMMLEGSVLPYHKE